MIGDSVAAVSDEPVAPFFLIVADHDRGVFAIEGPMTDDRPWLSAARAARDHRPGRVRPGCAGGRTCQHAQTHLRPARQHHKAALVISWATVSDAAYPRRRGTL